MLSIARWELDLLKYSIYLGMDLALSSDAQLVAASVGGHMALDHASHGRLTTIAQTTTQMSRHTRKRHVPSSPMPLHSFSDPQSTSWVHSR